MKIRTVVALSLLLAFVASGTALAEDKVEKKEAEKPNLEEMDGKELYKTLCKQCHAADSDAGEFTPMSLIVEQWEEFFDGGFAETHAEVACPSDPEVKVVDHFSKDILKKLKKFCVDHAADSEQPMTCG